ncbi:MAG: pyrroline-5-carboxylate reductase [Desulfuromonadales bacterium]|nr:pyrroline-5-carboxylate reductase [Desulfuromonadales bacterium]
MLKIDSVGFVGGGNMAEAILKGVLQSGYPSGQVAVFEPDSERAAYLAETYRIRIARSNRELVEQSALVVLAVKPQLLQTVLPEVVQGWGAGKLLVSILAGVTTAQLENGFSSQPAVVRAMPNTPAMIGAGATAICSGKFLTGVELDHAWQLFATIGDVVIVDEAQMDAVTGLSGSGPAYIYAVIEALTAGGVANGLSQEIALKLATQTVIGAASMVQQTAEEPAVLRQRVCSPGGTTLAAIELLEQRGLSAILIDAVGAATERSRELGRE